jgi:hypothetical protein
MATAREQMASKITRHPVVSFFVFSFAISWIIWFLASFFTGNKGSLLNTIDLIGAFGPALSAIFIASLVNPAPSNLSSKKRWTIFLVFFVATSALQLFSGLFLTQSFDIASVVATVLIDVIASYVVSSVYHPKEGVSQLLSSLKRVSVKSVWLWIALFLPFIFQILGAMIDLGVGGNGLLSLSAISIISIAASYPFILFFGGPLNEEPGWRAFALVKTQYNYTPLATGLIIGLIWSAWHLPLHITAFYDNGVSGFFCVLFLMFRSVSYLCGFSIGRMGICLLVSCYMRESMFLHNFSLPVLTSDCLPTWLWSFSVSFWCFTKRCIRCVLEGKKDC